MKIVENGYEKPVAIALGLFDSVHRGHAKIIGETKKLADFFGAECAVFTFKNNPFGFFRNDVGTVFTFDERARIFADMNVDVVVAKTMSEEYARTSPEAFLKNLFSDFDIKAVVCGADYTFGYKGDGNVGLLTRYAESRGAFVRQTEYLCDENGDRISSSRIRKLIADGGVAQANMLLGRPYEISGKVVHCCGRGRAYGFPTANVFVPDEKHPLAQGVYATTVEVDGREYDSLTNVGIKPTFDDYSLTVESFLLDFSGNLYGKDIVVRFYKKIRDIMKFVGEREIHEQILKDISVAEKIERKL